MSRQDCYIYKLKVRKQTKYIWSVFGLLRIVILDDKFSKFIMLFQLRMHQLLLFQEEMAEHQDAEQR